jgi:hypothetical protein
MVGRSTGGPTRADDGRTNERTNGLTTLHFVQQHQATTDSPTLNEKAGGQALLDRAKAFGFTGTAVTVC